MLVAVAVARTVEHRELAELAAVVLEELSARVVLLLELQIQAVVAVVALTIAAFLVRQVVQVL
jgi:hypothetical protein